MKKSAKKTEQSLKKNFYKLKKKRRTCIQNLK